MFLPTGNPGAQKVLSLLNDLRGRTSLYYVGILKYFKANRPFPNSMIYYNPDDQRFYYERAKKVSSNEVSWRDYVPDTWNPKYIRAEGGSFLYLSESPFNIILCNAAWINSRPDLGAEDFYNFIQKYVSLEREIWKTYLSNERTSEGVKPLF
ncbi:MAG TPA: hypothetical protein PK122_06765 [Candidatus Paceibacterota bacterium]|nr:hypothetical protein [Candidatus Paceibacterota bacterium]